MKTITKILAFAAVVILSAGCIKETFPQSSYVTTDQAASAPNSFGNFVDACTILTGQFSYSGSSNYPWDFGYPSFFLQRDVMGQDIACESSSSEWYTTWYTCGTGLGPQYAVCQLPWTYYYSWIDNCNKVISLAGEEPSDLHKSGAGIAYAMRAMFYMDIARMYGKTYKNNEDAPTVPIVTEKTTLEQATANPRATNKDMWDFIISDLEKAEVYLDGYKRTSNMTPDLSVVYGLKARAYLTMEDWPNAEKYAKLAQEGYTPLTAEQYTDKETAFNSATSTNAWIFATGNKPDDPNILNNDGDSSWASQMTLETSSGMGYAANYGTPKRIDAHLYATIPETDCRKKCYIDPALDEIASYAELVAALEEYSDYPENLIGTAMATASKNIGCLSLKFREAGGDAGKINQYVGFCVDIPLMRVEEMMLIEAEAAGMQDEARGKTLLANFAKLRDPQWTYDSMTSFRDQVWWQRRVELWGEGFATFDIKRLNKGITRSYAGTNHPEGYRWNTNEPPQWMDLCIVQTETNYNTACTNNPTPIAPTSDSPEFQW
ncbi:MAG: RagB/SusD family nutrient uptake outer membrane protein [Candidatus Cryptobacteroides sp.]